MPIAVSQAVISVLEEAVSSGEWEDVKARLPEEYTPILGVTRAERNLMSIHIH